MSARSYTLHRDERTKITNYLEPGAPLEHVVGPDGLREWSLLRREPGRVLLEHWSGALAQVDVDPRDRVLGHRLLEGGAAREAADCGGPPGGA